MPAFGGTHCDAEIAAVANYVTARFGSRGSQIAAQDIAERCRGWRGVPREAVRLALLAAGLSRENHCAALLQSPTFGRRVVKK
jgi:hypothetical protein